MLGALRRFIQEGDVVYDVGANIGLYSRFMAQCFHAARVIAFEPVPANRILLAENLDLGRCVERVTVVPCAMGDEDGTVDFQIDDLTSNSGTLDAVTHGEASQSRKQYGLTPATMKVEVARLDTLIEQRGFPVPTTIKVDVEGAEALVVTGASRLLAEHGPRIVIELHGAEYARDTLKALWRVGYHCFGHLSVGGTTAYREILPADLEKINEIYSLHFVAASPTADDLKEPIQDFGTAD